MQMVATTSKALREGRSRVKNIVREISKYPLDEKLSMPKRIAHCLDWCAQECPNQYVPFQILLKAVMGYGKTPNANSKEVEGLRSKWTPVRRILLEQYQRDLVVERGVGVRATDGSEDVAKNTLGVKVRRFERSKQAIEKTLAIVDVSSIKDKQLRTWVGELRPAFKMLSSPDFVKKLLPPRDDGADEDKKK